MELRQRHLTSGFSTMEVVVVVAIIGILASIGVTGYLRANERASLKSQTDMLATAIRQAQSNAQTSVQGRSWGVRCVGSTWERFSLSGSTTETDVQASLRQPVRCFGSAEARFAKLTGTPVANVDFTVTDGTTSKKIVVKTSGTIVVE